MSDGWRSSDADSRVVAKSPFNSNDEAQGHEKDSVVTRAGWGDNLAPLAANNIQGSSSFFQDIPAGGPDPNANGSNGQRPWRAGFGSVAPIAQENIQGSSSFFQDIPAGGPDPNANGSNGQRPWRAGFGDVAPIARNNIQGSSSFFQDIPAGGPDPNANGGNGHSPWRAGDSGSGVVAPIVRNSAIMDASSPDQTSTSQQWRGSYPDSSYKGPAQVDNGSPNPSPWLSNNPGSQNQPWRGSYPDSSYKGPGPIENGSPNSSPWLSNNQGSQNPAWRGGYPDSNYQGPAAPQSQIPDWKTYAQQQMQQMQAQSGHPGGDAPGVPGNPSVNPISDATRQAIESSLHLKTSVDGYLGTGFFTGGAIGATEWALDKAVLAAGGKAETGVLGWWAEHSPLLNKAGTNLADLAADGPGSLVGRTFNGAFKGLAVSGATLAAGYALDKLGASVFGYKQPETDGLKRFMVDGVAVPAILLSDLPGRWKFFLGFSALASAHAAEAFGGTGASLQMSTLLRPNTCDGVLMTAAAMAPVDYKTKAMLLAGAWGVGRVYNEIAHFTGLDGGSPAKLRDDSGSAFEHDKTTRTEKSFENAVEKGKTLGKENEVALELQFADWLNKQSTTNPITHDRGIAVLGDALGEFRLEAGARLDPASHADKKDRILKGANLDFGGEATSYLRWAAGSLIEAQNYVITHKGQTVEGQVMDDAYIQQLKNLQTKVEGKLNLVYGSHDIPGIFNELTKQVRVNSGDMQHALVRMKNTLDVSTSKDPRFLAKSNRDMAIGWLAEASYMTSRGNGEEARICYQAAVQNLQNSERLDSSAPDNQALEKIQSDVAKGIPGAISSQYGSHLNNPFQLNTPNYGPNLLGK